MRRGFRRIVELLVWLVILPTVVLMALGILMLVLWGPRLNLVFGVLVVTLVGCLTTGAVLTLLLLHREARRSRLQLEFVSKVNHQLREPLVAMREHVGKLRSERQIGPAQLRRRADALLEETGRLRDRIDRLLEWGRMEAGRRPYSLQPEVVEELIAEAGRAVAPMLQARGQELVVVVPPELPSALVDRQAVIDALVNLLANASAFSASGSSIEVGGRAERRTLHLWVRDPGIGIPRREHRNIFLRFYRLRERRLENHEGPGLGLSIVHHVVKGHGGRVRLDSEPGRGSTFTIELPLSGQ